MAAIADLTTLQSAITDWVARTDITTSAVNQFIDLAETDIQYGIYGMDGRAITQPLRVKAMETRNAAFALSGEYTTLPTDFLGFREVKLTSASPNVPLNFVTPGYFDASYASTNSTTTAKVYSVVDGTLRVGPGASATDTLEIIYYAKIPQLTVSNTNWLCTKYPNVYLYGALRHLAIYTGMDSRLALFQAGFIGNVAALAAAENGMEFSGTSLVQRPVGVTIT